MSSSVSSPLPGFVPLSVASRLLPVANGSDSFLCFWTELTNSSEPLKALFFSNMFKSDAHFDWSRISKGVVNNVNHAIFTATSQPAVWWRQSNLGLNFSLKFFFHSYSATFHVHNRVNFFRERLSENDTWHYEMSYKLGLLKHNLTEASTPTTNICDAHQLNNANVNQAITSSNMKAAWLQQFRMCFSVKEDLSVKCKRGAV